MARIRRAEGLWRGGAGQLVAAVATAAVLSCGLWAAAPVAQARTSKCLIINAAINTSYRSLQAAQDAATAGDTLRVRGTCTGITEIGKSLTVTGQHPRGFTTPTLNGGGQGSVLTVDPGVTLTVNTLTITGGSGTVIGGGNTFGGGILNLGRFSGPGGAVVLNDTSITGNQVTGQGGGIQNQFNASVTLNGSSTITGNSAFSGGGIFNAGTVTGATATNITGNTPDNCAGTVPGCVG